MKVFKIISVLALCLTASLVHTQDVELDSYKFGEGLRFTADEDHKIRISGYVQPYAESKQFTEADAEESMNRFRMRRLRLRMDGVLPDERFSYRFQVDLSGASEVGDAQSTNNYLLDAYVSYNVTNRIKLSFGQRSTYTDNRELFMSSRTLQLVERSRLTSAFSSIREFGFFAQGNFRTGSGSYLKPYFVLTNGDGSNAFEKDHGGLKVGGRIDFLPFGLFTNLGQFRQADVMRELIPKIVVGVNYSKNNGMSSRRGRESGAILYLNDADEESLPDYTKYGADFMIKYKGFSVLGEYIKTEADVPTDITQRVRNNGSTSTTFDVNGIQNVENYVKGRMMLGTAYNIQLGYLFKNGFSVDGRYTQLEADDNSFLNNGTFYNRPKYYTIGLGKYLSRNYGAKVQASYTYVKANPGINDLNGNQIAGDEWIARLMVTFSL
ncbi:MAG: porin [Flavobacteriaceae bacterium]|nr:porin [Flavobacteriaceae bacterium]